MPDTFLSSEIANVLPPGSSPALYRFITTKLQQGVSKSQVFSASPTFTQWIQSYGWTTYTSGGSNYAYKSFTSVGSQNVDLYPFTNGYDFLKG